MKQKFAGNILVTALLLCLLMTGNAFATNYAYVLVPGDDVIRVYNYEGGTLSATLDLDGGSYIYDYAAYALDTDPTDGIDGTEITTYVTTIKNYDPNSTRTFGTIAAMEVGPQERYLYFVTDYGADTSGELYQLDITGDPSDDITAFSKITKLAEVGRRPKDIVVDNLGNYVFVANYGDNSVTKYIKSSGTALKISGFYKPIALAVTSGSITTGSDLYVANFEMQSEKYYVSMYNTFNKIDIEVTHRPTDIVTTLDNEYVYVSNSSGSAGLISVIKPIDYLDVESDGDIITDPGENTVVKTIEISGALPSKMVLVDLENMIYAIDPVFGESGDNLTIAAGANKMTVVDITGRLNDEYTVSQNVTVSAVDGNATTAYTSGISIAGTRNGTSVFTVTGSENSFFKADITGITANTLTTTLFDTADGVNEAYSQIILGGTMPTAVSALSAEAKNGKILLHWYDSADDELGYFIFRRDMSKDDNEYKFYLFDAVESNTGLTIDEDDPQKREYTDDTVNKGHNYDYLVVPYNEITRSNTGTPVNVKARDDSSSDICFISSVNTKSGSSLMVLTLIAGFILIAAVRRQKT